MSLLVAISFSVSAAKATNGQGGLIYLHYRYLDPTLGRFISSDPTVPSSDNLGLNRHEYGGNSPQTFIDSSGLGKVSAIEKYVAELIEEFLTTGRHSKMFVSRDQAAKMISKLPKMSQDRMFDEQALEALQQCAESCQSGISEYAHAQLILEKTGDPSEAASALNGVSLDEYRAWLNERFTDLAIHWNRLDRIFMTRADRRSYLLWIETGNQTSEQILKARSFTAEPQVGQPLREYMGAFPPYSSHNALIFYLVPASAAGAAVITSDTANARTPAGGGGTRAPDPATKNSDQGPIFGPPPPPSPPPLPPKCEIVTKIVPEPC